MEQLLVLFFSGDGEGRVLGSCGDGSLPMGVCILLVFCCLYAYQLCILMFMITSNVCVHPQKKPGEMNYTSTKA
jgi:hypothetical protein